ncbi:MFS transporter [Phycicoccus sp. MQZ13P-5]|uniref:MFS transporter n=2 Tax=Phycicoccus sonneratiae TaxID=2807628 RepID=A0ABS2CKP6_9MICO|nr:MFS transporter [Phycicoccus sonneraticus]
MLVLDATVVNVALPRIATDLGFGPATLSWVLNGYTLAFGGLLLLGGRLGDVLGRLRTFQVGLALFTIASFVGGLAPTAGALVAARAAQGVGAALAAPGVLALLTTSAPDEEARRRGYALFGAVSSGGASIGLLLGGLLTDLGSWRWTLWINVPIGLAVLLLAPRFVEETPRVRGRFDVLGAVLATSGAVALVYALIETPTYGWSSDRTLGTAALGLVLLGALAVVETRVAEPMLRLHLLRSRRRLGSLAVMALVVGGQLSMFFLVVQFLQRTLGFGPMASGLAFLPLSLGIFGMSRLTPRLVGRFGAAPLMVVGVLGLLVSFVWMSGVSEQSTYWTTAFGALLVNGLSAGLVFMPVTMTALAGVEPQDAGAASGMLQTFQQLGSAVGVAAIVSVYAAGAVPDAFTPGAREAFLTSAAFASLALLVALGLARPRRARDAATGPEADDVPELAATGATPAVA